MQREEARSTYIPVTNVRLPHQCVAVSHYLTQRFHCFIAFAFCFSSHADNLAKVLWIASDRPQFPARISEFARTREPFRVFFALMPAIPRFEEIDFRPTPLGDLILRRRTIPDLGNREAYEIILGDAYLMTSLFTAVEIALSTLGMAATAKSFPNTKLDVVVGGLGLGYTAKEALDHPALGSLTVVDYLEPVIEWHQKGLVPLGRELSDSPRCSFVHADFFKAALASPPDPGFDPDDAGRKFHAILLDIDHSPCNLLHERHAEFYRPEGLEKMAAKLHPGGTFGMWSDDPPADSFLDALSEVFTSIDAHVVKFQNPHLGTESASTVYLAT